MGRRRSDSSVKQDLGVAGSSPSCDFRVAPPQFLWYTMKRIRGARSSNHQERGGLPLADCSHVQQVGDALHYAHRQAWHRDVSRPTDDESRGGLRLRLRVARALQCLANRRCFVGTPRYMPGQVEGSGRRPLRPVSRHPGVGALTGNSLHRESVASDPQTPARDRLAQ